MQLGSAMNASGQPAYEVQERLTAVARAYGANSVRVSAFPTFLMVTMGRGEPLTQELTSSLGGVPRLDQIAAVHELALEAMDGTVEPSEGLRRLDAIGHWERRFGPLLSIAGYAVMAVGICLVLRPSPKEVLAAVLFGGIVGYLRWVVRHQTTLAILMPVVAAFSVSALSALAVSHGVHDLGIRPVVASLVVFLPGATLTTAVLELAAGQMVSGSSRLVSGGVQLGLLAFGIVAGVQAVGISVSRLFASHHSQLGAWAPWVGVLVFAVGVRIAHSAPRRSFPGMLVVLYAAWAGQVLGNVIFGGYVSGFVGAALMTVMAFLVSRTPSAMPAHALFLPGFWLLVPGALGLIGLTEFAGDANHTATGDVLATVTSIFAVALGVLFGTQLWAWAIATGRVVGEVSGAVPQSTRRALRRRPRGPGRRDVAPGPDDPKEDPDAA